MEDECCPLDEKWGGFDPWERCNVNGGFELELE